MAIACVSIPAPGSTATLVVWRGLSAHDVGQPFTLKGPATVQMTGQFGGPVTLEGSLDPSESAWFALTDHDNLPITKTLPDGEVVREAVYKVRPRAGAGVQSVDVWLYVP